MNNKRIIVSIILTLVLLIGGTYAVWNFITEKSKVTIKIDNETISLNSKDVISSDSINPVYSKENGIIKEIEVYKQNEKYIAGIDLYLNLKTFPTELATSAFRWELHKNGSYLSSGNLNSKKQGNTIKLTSYTQKINNEENKDTYRLYLWLDDNMENSSNIMNKSISFDLYGTASSYDELDIIVNDVEPNIPSLADGMIPIRYNYVIDEWVKADTSNSNNSWYDYNNKMWANAVLVDSSSRERYINAYVDTTIDEDDILAYYVWIPRYKYVLFNVDSLSIEPREIQIEFEKTTDPISQGDENGEFLSHPAFWWDNNSDGIRATDGSEELSGIWVGKFENGGTVDMPLIKPNIIALNSNTVYNFFNMIKKIESITYLNDFSSIDSHMMKNIEWGAIAYLSHSRYGINSDILKNKNASRITGIQGNYTYNDYLITNNVITSNKVPGTGVLASTTGTEYGIYDMSGGQMEYMMAVMKKSDGSIDYGWSGFNATNMVDSKYYDLYEFGDHYNYQRRILGDATGEVYGWYSAYAQLTGYNNSWQLRNGYSVRSNSSGLFSFGAPHGGSGLHDGRSNPNVSSRSVIVFP